MVDAIRKTGSNPARPGPPAPDVSVTGSVGPDELAWHDMDSPGPHGTRRMRRLDISSPDSDGLVCVDVLFRDSYWSTSEVESVIHEYSVDACIDTRTRVVLDVGAHVGVLPWQECPAAILSAGRIVGQPADALRHWVRQELSGTSTCTHLNDTLSGLADVPYLTAVLEQECR
jgi:hypothetical protein